MLWLQLPNNEQRRADRLGHVYSLAEVSVSGVTVFLQILIGYSLQILC